MKKIPLSVSHPDLIKLWHPIKNVAFNPSSVTARSHKKAHWKCLQHADHEWEAIIAHVARSYEKKTRSLGCPYCSGMKVNKSNCLMTTDPQIAKSWDEKNTLTPYDVTRCSNKKVGWQCLIDPEHRWITSINNRIKQGCPFCAGKRVTITSNLAAKYPKIASEWDYAKNNSLRPENFNPGSNKYAWWLCENGHSYRAKISHRTAGSRCPYCFGKKLSQERSLEYKRPDLAREFHPTKNAPLTPSSIHASSRLQVWWICSKNSNHVWQSTVDNRNKGNGCPQCLNRGENIGPGKSLADLYKELILEWDYDNNDVNPHNVAPLSNKKVAWVCSKNNQHRWKAAICHRVNGTGCPFCCGHQVTASTSLAATHPDVANEWHPSKNMDLTPYDVTAGSNQKIWWQCSKNSDHEWQTACYNRTIGKNGCPYCNSGWTIDKMRLFIRSILPHIDALTPAELFVLFQQTGILNSHGKAKAFIQAFKTGRFPKEELEKFVRGEANFVDQIIDQANNSQDQDKSKEYILEKDILEAEAELPTIGVKEALAVLETKITANLDIEAINFFIHSAVAKIWRFVFLNESIALEQLEKYKSDQPYPNEVKQLFLEQYNEAKNLAIPKGYNFKKNETLCLPNLMQRFTAFMVQKRKRFGNWSGTGAGKTLAAVLASRVINAKLTIICCPNSVVDGWERSIKEIYPDSVVITKDTRISYQKNQHHYVVLNYEFFQQPHAEATLKKLLNDTVDFIVIDEIHYSKQRVAEDMSKRRQAIMAMLSEARAKNADLHVLGMSATPVINNLFEGKTLIELITGLHHDDLDTLPTTSNCNALYQKFISHGTRYIPQYKQSLHVNTIEIDASHLLDEIKNVKGIRIGGSTVDLEAILTKAKIPEILKHLKPKTIVYTYYLKNILNPLQTAIEAAGWRTAVYSGDDKTGLEEFLHGPADILIATSCIGTGVDGLQEVCNRIIVNTLPWTHAEFEQLKGRIYRQGQQSHNVDIIVPLTYIKINDTKWSWCIDARWKRIQFKKSIADAAVDGIIPEGHLRTPGQAYRDAMLWLERLDRGEVYEIERRAISIPLSSDIPIKTIRNLGDLSQMNNQINQTPSSETHKRFKANPEEWESYHSIYRENRKDWDVIPYKEAINWCKSRPHMIIGDFGCGEALLAQELENQVHSFDHVAINESVIACDMSHVPLDDESLEAVIFSLSLMGSNYVDYLYEAKRCLKLDGHLWIAEPTSRIKDIDLFKELLDRLGFDVRRVHVKWKFTFIEALKSDRQINEVVLKDLDSKKILE